MENEVEHYKVSSDRVQELVKATGLPVLRVRDICMAPWPDKAVHQQWLDEASIDEIARWILHVDRQEREER